MCKMGVVCKAVKDCKAAPFGLGFIIIVGIIIVIIIIVIIIVIIIGIIIVIIIVIIIIVIITIVIIVIVIIIIVIIIIVIGSNSFGWFGLDLCRCMILTTRCCWAPVGYIGVIWGIMEKKMETTILEKKMETTI